VILDKFPAVAFQEGSYWGRKEELKLGTEAHACNPSTGRQRQEDHEFKDIHYVHEKTPSTE
jgi:hypothetical protein